MNTVLFSGNKNVTMDSREIAELTGKAHHHVMRDIRNMMEELDKPNLDYQSNQGLTKIQYETCEQTKRVNLYKLDRLHVECLLTGYSIPLRMKVLKRLAELEERVETPTLPQTYLQALEALVESEKEKVLLIEESTIKTEIINALDEKIENDAPLVDYANDVHVATNLMSFSDAAKSLGVGRNDLYAFCRSAKLLMDYPNRNVPYQQYINSGLFEVKQNTYMDNGGKIHVSNTTFVTGKGHRKLHKMLSEL